MTETVQERRRRRSSVLRQQQQNLHLAFQHLAVTTSTSHSTSSIKRQASHDHMSTPCRDYLTVHAPPALMLSTSQSSPIASPRSPNKNTSYPSPTRDEYNRPYSPYYDPEYTVSSPSSRSMSLKSDVSEGFSSQPSTPSGCFSIADIADPDTDHDQDQEQDQDQHRQHRQQHQHQDKDRKRRQEQNCYHDDTSEVPPELRAYKTTDKRDIYGFKKPLQHLRLQDIEKFEREYEPILDRQRSRWNALLAENGGQWPSISPKLKRYARKGIPRERRGQAWMHYSGAQAKMEANPDLYASLTKTAVAMGKHNEYVEIIHRDLHRTFPDNSEFSCAVTTEDGSVEMVPETNPKLCALRRILLAFSLYSPHIGYCQSLNYIAGFFLLFVQSEEAAFWMLVVTVLDYFPENMYDVTMEGAHIDQTVLVMMIYERMPGVWNKIGNGKCFWECVATDGLPSITLVTSHWFLTLFINILPIETVLRVWDCFFIEGSVVLFQVALTIIKMNEKKIWTLDDPIEMFPLLQSMPRRILNCHWFMDCVFSQTGVAYDICHSELERKRILFRDRRKQQRAASAHGSSVTKATSVADLKKPRRPL